jgi:hypothetical protein
METEDTKIVSPRPISLLAWRLELLRTFDEEQTEKIVQQVERAMDRRVSKKAA